jgi:dolichol-phosphate mannosyltransferase
MSYANLLVEESYYWNYAQHLDWSYLDHPPMVAVLIKIFTSILGTTEFGVRAASLFCWFICAFFSYKLSELIQPQSGRYAVVLLAALPFFFFQSIIITPDVPLITCWSASLYYLYRALVLKNTPSWYWVGTWIGLGMLSKYTICLVGFTTLVYVVTQSDARFWLRRKEPYLAALCAALFFSPVIYWNKQHEWISFIFQSSRRFNSTTSIDIQNLAWIILFFITPLGVWGLWKLAKRTHLIASLPEQRIKFMRYFTFVPLGFFSCYSLNHEINFNWSGPLFLAFIPWLALMMTNKPYQKVLWLRMVLFLLMSYSAILLFINYNTSEWIQQKILIKVIDWNSLIKKFNAIAAANEQKYHQPIYFAPLDNYPISSELAFYQNKDLNNGQIRRIYPSVGAHIFNRESLMYRFWDKNVDLSGAILILISKESWSFDDLEVTSRTIEETKLSQVWSSGQGQHIKNIPYYYKVVRLKR